MYKEKSKSNRVIESSNKRLGVSKFAFALSTLFSSTLRDPSASRVNERLAFESIPFLLPPSSGGS